jgi:eukaryotic-like serine/threonine-protein kinase
VSAPADEDGETETAAVAETVVERRSRASVSPVATGPEPVDDTDDEETHEAQDDDLLGPLAPPPPPATGSNDAAAPAPSTRTKTGTSAPADASTTIGSPMDALARDEVLRTRRFVVIGLLIALGGVIALPFLPGDPTATKLLVASISIASVGLTYLLFRTRNAVRLHGWAVAFAWYIPAICVTTAIPYFGAFSPAPILLVLGVYFTGMGSSRWLATSIYLSCAASQALTAGLVIGGVTRDTGIVRPEGLSTRTAIVLQILVQLVLAATFIIARVSRRTALVAVTELEGAIRAVAQREALLDEAREELERALRSGRGRGRFTDQTIGGYKLGGVLGRGAMGEVYEAAPVAGGEPVAMKLLSQASLGNVNHVRRFLRELRTASAIESPNVVRVLAVGETPVPYLVMERLDGKDLGDTLRGRRHLTPAQVVDLVRQVGAGITAAGAAGVVHRDLKPQNLVLHHGTWKILDFGVSRAGDHGGTLTHGHVVGTPAYMSPEQAKGIAVDHRTDLYALAAIAYRALTGHPPYAGREVAQTIYKVVHVAPPRPSSVATLPSELDLVLAIGMAKDPAKRFATAAELAEALAAAVDGVLPEGVRDRGRALDRAGAWSG